MEATATNHIGFFDEKPPMIEEDEIKQQEHWRALAEQLGLEPAPETVSDPPPKVVDDAPAPPAVPSEAVRAEPLPRAVGPPAAEQPSIPLRYHRSEEAGVKKMREEVPPAAEPEEEQPWEPAPSAEVAEPVEVSHSRRRRGTRPPGAAEGGPSAEEGSSRETGEGDETPRRGRGERGRRRGRGRVRTEEPAGEPKQTPEPLAVADDDIAPSTEVDVEVPEADNEDLDEVDTLSDWNVPSWNELIASLYRPDR